MNKKISPSRDSFAKWLELVVLSLISAYFLMNLFTKSYKKTADIKYLAHENTAMLFITLIVIFAIFLAIAVLYNASAKYITLFTTILYCIATVGNYSGDIYICLGAIIVTALVFVYCLDAINKIPDILGEFKYGGIILATAAGIFLTVFISLNSIYRHDAFRTPNFDFGLFAQMYKYMSETGLPLTTLERQELGLFSHFGVHISPIVYITLPLYMLFPYAETVQVMQALVLGVAVIPLYMLCRHYKLSGTFSGLICIIYSLTPAFAAGTFYDYHENCYIPVFLLAFILALEKKNALCMGIFGLFVCMAKEDAAFYIIIVGIYFILSKRDIMRGLASCVGAVAYFGIAMALLHTYGLGDLASTRFGNVMYDPQGGLSQILITTIANPAFVLSQIFNADKLPYILLTLLPISYALFQKKNYSRYVLLGTYIVFNLISNYQYLHDIKFQYTFGSATLILYLAIITVSEWEPPKRKNWGLMSALICLILFCGFCFPTLAGSMEIYNKNPELYTEMDEALAKLPKDASVVGSAFMVSHMTHVDNIMSITQDMMPTQDYIVIDNRYSTNDLTKLNPAYVSEYRLITDIPGGLQIYERIPQ